MAHSILCICIMFCSSCGKRITEGAKFCVNCGKVGDILREKYGQGSVFTEQCPKCGHESLELYTAGVHEASSGSIRVYYEDDKFECPNCPTELSKDEEKGAEECASGSGVHTSAAKIAHKPKVKSFAAYKKSKGSEWKNKVSGTQARKESCEQKEVLINIGIMEWNEKEKVLKPKRGKKLVVRVNPSIDYPLLEKEAQDKWQVFHSNLYDSQQSYHLLYEDGKKAVFLPGSTESFTLKKYQEAINRDFKRITLFLVTDDDYQTSMGETSDDDFMTSPFDTNETEHTLKRVSIDLTHDMTPCKRPAYSTTTIPSSTITDLPSDFIISTKQLGPSTETCTSTASTSCTAQLSEIIDDEQFAKELQAIYDEAIATTDSDKNEKNVYVSTLIQEFEKQVDATKQFNVVIRRGIDIFRKLSIWKRAANKEGLANHPLRIKYAGEQGIDTGAMAKEFFTEALTEIGLAVFPSGSPINSTFHIQNGNFRACGQIAAASLSQGGPPPALLNERVYNVMVNPDIDLTDVDVNQHLTEEDHNSIKSILDDLPSNTDVIIDHGYTGPINSLRKKEISSSIAVSIISKRSTYLKEFMVGLKDFGVSFAVKTHPDVMKELFVFQSQNENKVDGNYLFSILVPHYSDEGSVRRKVEEAIMDSFQDLLFRVEDGLCPFSHSEAIACNEDHDSQQDVSGTPLEQSTTNTTAEPNEALVADLSIPGIMGWLTGQRHKPIGNESLLIDVHFDHDCMIHNPNHTLCFPIVGACAKQLTIPVQHMKSPLQFEEVFLLAFGKGQSFARH